MSEAEAEAEATVEVESPKDALFKWRLGEFVGMDFAGYAAELLALRCVSPAEARALLSAGCDHATALQILL